jgi:hypothetical protein
MQEILPSRKPANFGQNKIRQNHRRAKEVNPAGMEAGRGKGSLMDGQDERLPEHPLHRLNALVDRHDLVTY